MQNIYPSVYNFIGIYRNANTYPNKKTVSTTRSIYTYDSKR